MNATSIIKQVTDRSIKWELESALRTGFIIGRFEKQIDEFSALYPDAKLDLVGSIELTAQSRQEVLDFIRIFGGQWKKDLDYGTDGFLIYKRSEEVSGVFIRLEANNAPPPPSCQIIEEEVEVPARKEKRKKIICTPVDQDEVPLVQAEPEAKDEVPL